MVKYPFPILAKPSGITLEQHVEDVMSESSLLLKCQPFIFEKYQYRIGKDLNRRLVLVCKFHDDGKNSSLWQEACQKDYLNYLEWQAENQGKSFKEYSQINGEKAGENIRKVGIRHEFQSLILNDRKKMPLPLQCAIAAHHAKLSFAFEDKWKEKKEYERFWTDFRRKSNEIIEQNDLRLSADTLYEYAAIRGLLQLLDHRASAKENGDFVPNFMPFIYKFPHSAKRNVQKLVEEYWQDELLLVRASTGAGKTDASLLWASKQIENKRADRLVIAMPTRFTSNALAINITESLSNTGLYHSSAWFTKFQGQIDEGQLNIQEAIKMHEFARLLETPVTVCTIDHLLMALTLTREDHHLITFNLANSCLVIDEADFYDDFTRCNILVLLKILRYWKVPVLLMSASLPESILYDYKNIGYQIDEIIEDKSDNDRIRFNLKEIRRYSELSEIEDLLLLCVKKKSAIIYANTVDKAISIFKWFEAYRQIEPTIKPILYHSRFTEPDKEKKESELIKALGKDAWNRGNAEGIAILTQIGEMSINISADIMISEICPIDRLTQRIGRLVRFDKSKIGELYVISPHKNGCLYSVPYGEYDGKDKSWISCEALNKTIAAIEPGYYNAGRLVNLLNLIYSNETNFSDNAIANATKLKEYFIYNWLIRPKQKTEADDTETCFWKSRNIALQDFVYVQKPESTYFSSYSTFQYWSIANLIEIPVYLIAKGFKMNRIEKVNLIIADQQKTIYVIRKEYYSYLIGIDLT